MMRSTAVACSLKPKNTHAPRKLNLFVLSKEIAPVGDLFLFGRGVRVREADEGVKPGAQAPGSWQEKRSRARETGDSAVAHFAGSDLLCIAHLGLATQALGCHLLRRFRCG